MALYTVGIAMIRAIENRDIDEFSRIFNREAWDLYFVSYATPLISCCNHNWYEGVKCCIEKHAQDVNEVNIFNSTPLHSAKQVIIAKLLCENGANPNIQTKKSRSTPLHNSAQGRYLGVMEVLIDFGADPEIKDRSDKTAYDYMLKEDVGLMIKYAKEVKLKKEVKSMNPDQLFAVTLRHIQKVLNMFEERFKQIERDVKHLKEESPCKRVHVEQQEDK